MYGHVLQPYLAWLNGPERALDLGGEMQAMAGVDDAFGAAGCAGGEEDDGGVGGREGWRGGGKCELGLLRVWLW